MHNIPQDRDTIRYERCKKQNIRFVVRNNVRRGCVNHAHWPSWRLKELSPRKRHSNIIKKRQKKTLHELWTVRIQVLLQPFLSDSFSLIFLLIDFFSMSIWRQCVVYMIFSYPPVCRFYSVCFQWNKKCVQNMITDHFAGAFFHRPVPGHERVFFFHRLYLFK